MGDVELNRRDVLAASLVVGGAALSGEAMAMTGGEADMRNTTVNAKRTMAAPATAPTPRTPPASTSSPAARI